VLGRRRGICLLGLGFWSLVRRRRRGLRFRSSGGQEGEAECGADEGGGEAEYGGVAFLGLRELVGAPGVD
jgi:hypothetical protein